MLRCSVQVRCLNGSCDVHTNKDVEKQFNIPLCLPVNSGLARAFVELKSGENNNAAKEQARSNLFKGIISEKAKTFIDDLDNKVVVDRALRYKFACPDGSKIVNGLELINPGHGDVDGYIDMFRSYVVKLIDKSGIDNTVRSKREVLTTKNKVRNVVNRMLKDEMDCLNAQCRLALQPHNAMQQAIGGGSRRT